MYNFYQCMSNSNQQTKMKEKKAYLKQFKLEKKNQEFSKIKFFQLKWYG